MSTILKNFNSARIGDSCSLLDCTYGKLLIKLIDSNLSNLGECSVITENVGARIHYG